MGEVWVGIHCELVELRLSCAVKGVQLSAWPLRGRSWESVFWHFNWAAALLTGLCHYFGNLRGSLWAEWRLNVRLGWLFAYQDLCRRLWSVVIVWFPQPQPFWERFEESLWSDRVSKPTNWNNVLYLLAHPGVTFRCLLSAASFPYQLAMFSGLVVLLWHHKWKSAVRKAERKHRHPQ